MAANHDGIQLVNSILSNAPLRRSLPSASISKTSSNGTQTGCSP